MQREKAQAVKSEAESINADVCGGLSHSSIEDFVMKVERRA